MNYKNGWTNMEKNILYNSIFDIQKEYLELLKQFKKIEEENAKYIIDSIKTFWFLKKNIIEAFLNNFANDYDTCVFLCGSYINTFDNRHLPFYALSKKHIIDDVVLKFSIISLQDPSLEIVKTATKTLTKAINDNINCLEKFPDILILPISFLFDDMKVIKKGADNVFFSIFKDKNLTLEKYMNSFKNLDELFVFIDEELKDSLYFGDCPELPLKERYETYLQETKFSLPSYNEVFNFYVLTSSLFAQALSIILLCVRFNFYPYIRENMIFYNFMTLLKNFESIISPKVKELTLIHFLFFKIFDNDYEKMSLENTIKIKKYAFISNICSRITKQKVTVYGPGSFNQIKNFIIEELDKIGITIRL